MPELGGTGGAGLSITGTPSRPSRSREERAMKMSDVVVGEEYAYSPTISHRPTFPSRVRVLEVGVYRQVWGGWSKNRSNRADGVRVEYLHRETGVVTGQDAVLPRFLHWTWADEKVYQEKREKALAERIAREDSERERLDVALQTLGLSSRGFVRSEVRLTLEELEGLAARVDPLLDLYEQAKRERE
jgi:hypothetical protein